MVSMFPNNIVHFVVIAFTVLTVSVVAEDFIKGIQGNSTGRIYGTWRARQIQRSCRHDLLCRYKENDCMNTTNQNTSTCNQINDAIAANNCLITMCDEDRDMVCLEAPPSGDFVMVKSDSCPTGYNCYMKNSSVTTATTTPLMPTTTVTTVTLYVPTDQTGSPTTSSSTVRNEQTTDTEAVSTSSFLEEAPVVLSPSNRVGAAPSANDLAPELGVVGESMRAERLTTRSWEDVLRANLAAVARTRS